MRRSRTAQESAVILAFSSGAREFAGIRLSAPTLVIRKRRRLEGVAWALAAAIGLGPASSAFAADDLAAQVRILTDRLNATTERLNATDNEVRSLRSQLKQYQSKSAKRWPPTAPSRCSRNISALTTAATPAPFLKRARWAIRPWRLDL